MKEVMLRRLFFYGCILINFVAQIFVYLHMQGKLDTTPQLDGIKEDGLFLLIPSALLLLVSPFYKKYKLITKFLAVLSLVVVAVILAAYIGVYQAMSPFDKPQYVVSILVNVAVLALLDGGSKS